jgi:hypothetical protein
LLDGVQGIAPTDKPKVLTLGSQCLYIALDAENVPLPKARSQPPFEVGQEPPRFLLVGRNHAGDDNFITMRDTSQRPEAFVRLGEEGESSELSEESLLVGLKLLRFNLSAVVVVERHEEVIFFHQS